jgi:hypothetical protein
LEVGVQNDVTYLAIILGLFVLMFALVHACDLIIGSDEAVLEEEGTGAPDPVGRPGDDEEVAA